MPVFGRLRDRDAAVLTPGLVRELVRDQHPDLADERIELGARGWDNQLWRLGDHLAVRIPWQTSSADALLLKENTWVPTLAPLLPLPVPVPQRLGRPSRRYPRPWLITTWVPGAPADSNPVTFGSSAAEALAAFMDALHKPSPPAAPEGRERGGPLCEVAKRVESQLDALAGLLDAVAGVTSEPRPDVDAIRATWSDAVSTPSWDGPPLWLHGDLHPANVLTAEGDVCGVVDFGDLCAGDPALDIAACWILLPDLAAIDRFRAAHPLAHADDTWRRARGWAIWRALGSLAIASAGHAGAKPSWGPPAAASLQRLGATAA